MILLRAGKRHGAGSTPGSYSETSEAAGRDDRPRELGVRRRVVAVDAAAEHRDRPSVDGQRPAMRLAVDPAREAADDDRIGLRDAARERARDGASVARAGSRADDGDGGGGEQRRIRLAPQP